MVMQNYCAQSFFLDEAEDLALRPGVRTLVVPITESPLSIDMHGVKRDLDKFTGTYWNIEHRVLWALGRSIVGTPYFFTPVYL